MALAFIHDGKHTLLMPLVLYIFILIRYGKLRQLRALRSLCLLGPAQLYPAFWSRIASCYFLCSCSGSSSRLHSKIDASFHFTLGNLFNDIALDPSDISEKSINCFQTIQRVQEASEEQWIARSVLLDQVGRDFGFGGLPFNHFPCPFPTFSAI